MSELNYFLPGGIRQRSTVYKDATKLVHATVTCGETRAAGHGDGGNTHGTKQWMPLDEEEDGGGETDSHEDRKMFVNLI